ncbi:hypothetical protein ACE193_22470 [Bernardetia sp. OM2101]|uniref:hypothetical protein n=1 Tax=Bernardetia sp. OM2101 TaxID=3344876 RepID=UPI0035D0AAAC
MEKILDREDQIKLKRNKTWIIIILTNSTLLLILYLLFSNSIQGIKQLIIVGIGMVSIIFINLIIAVIIRLYSNSKDWKKWGIASLISFFTCLGIYFSFLS